jgi:phosphoglucosamine mutase
MARMFGTDGVRGLANVAPMSPDMALQVGRSAVEVLAAPAGRRPCVVVGRDTRLSGTMIEGALSAGLCSAGADVISVGVLPTAGVAYLTRQLGAIAGVMISASHNPYMDNGIKFFSATGMKLEDALEDAIEAGLNLDAAASRPTGADIGRLIETDDPVKRYADFLALTFIHDTPVGLRIGLDCANGAASSVAPQLFKQLGAQVSVWHAAPDGLNINDQCGSLHPEFLQQQVVAEGLDVGFAFDGDADRLVAIDHTGQLLDGDHILAVSAQDLLARDALPHNLVISTVMANLGLDKALQGMGVALHKTQVGDKYVMQAMRERGAVLGGEQSGHILFLDHHTTGDGILTAVQLLNAMVTHQVPLAELAQTLQKFPQLLLNVRLQERRDPLALPAVQEAIQAAAEQLGEDGRIVVRLSGTEALARVMVEGPAQAVIEPMAQRIARAIAAELGAPSAGTSLGGESPGG